MLLSGYSAEVIGKNVGRLTKMRIPHSEAITIALTIARNSYRKTHPTGNFPKVLQAAGKFYRKNPVKASRVKKKVITRKIGPHARKNPVSTVIKVFKHGEKKFKQVGYFTGTGWDTSISKAEKYSAGTARQLSTQLKIPAGWGLALVSA